MWSTIALEHLRKSYILKHLVICLRTTKMHRFCISQSPETEKKVLAELEKLGLLPTKANPSPRPLEYADLNNMTYTYNAIKV